MARSLSLGASAAACGVERIGRSDDRSAIEADR
jgi:hypothetical protein